MADLSTPLQHLEIVQEHGVLLRHFAALQRTCTEQAAQQAAEIVALNREIARLNAQLFKARVQSIISQTASDWGLKTLRTVAPDAKLVFSSGASACSATELPASHKMSELEESLRQADLVICQTGCVSHSAFWRVEDHCKRTGKTCVMVEHSDALHIVRVLPSSQGAPDFESTLGLESSL